MRLLVDPGKSRIVPARAAMTIRQERAKGFCRNFGIVGLRLAKRILEWTRGTIGISTGARQVSRPLILIVLVLVVVIVIEKRGLRGRGRRRGGRLENPLS